MTQMTDYEARLILGIEEIENPNHQIISSAFLKLISNNHPDRQGSEFLSAKIIEARNKLIHK